MKCRSALAAPGACSPSNTTASFPTWSCWARLGGGVFPLAALIARREFDIAADRALGHYTHEKSSVGCAAGLATLEVIEREHLLDRSRKLGARALERMHALQRRHRLVAEVRGIGLLLAIELARDGRPPGTRPSR